MGIKQGQLTRNSTVLSSLLLRSIAERDSNSELEKSHSSVSKELAETSRFQDKELFVDNGGQLVNMRMGMCMQIGMQVDDRFQIVLKGSLEVEFGVFQSSRKFFCNASSRVPALCGSIVCTWSQMSCRIWVKAYTKCHVFTVPLCNGFLCQCLCLVRAVINSISNSTKVCSLKHTGTLFLYAFTDETNALFVGAIHTHLAPCISGCIDVHQGRSSVFIPPNFCCH